MERFRRFFFFSATPISIPDWFTGALKALVAGARQDAPHPVRDRKETGYSPQHFSPPRETKTQKKTRAHTHTHTQKANILLIPKPKETKGKQSISVNS